MWIDDIPHVPGADTQDRFVVVRAITCHRTIGRWPGDYSVGKTRLHSTPGTFNFLVGQDPGQWAQFYRADCRCSHAAGGNYAGPGIEFSGLNDERLTPWQIHAGGLIIAELERLYGIPHVLHDDPRIWLDQSAYRGSINHRGIDYPPDPSFRHYDYITDDEFRAGGAPAPAPLELEEDDDEMSETLVTWLADNKPGEWHFATCGEFGGDLWHHFGPGGDKREFLAGPNGKLFGRPVTPAIIKVTKRLGVPPDTRLDLFVEFRGDPRVGHLWRPSNAYPFAFEYVE